MNVEMAREVLGWCLVLNWGILVLWVFMFLTVRDRIHGLHARWFRLSREQFDAVHFAGMAIFKVGILLLNLTPWISLRLLG